MTDINDTIDESNCDYNVDELRSGFVSDNDSVAAVIGENSNDEETLTLLEGGGLGGRMAQIKNQVQSNNRVYNTMRTVAMTFGVVLILAFAVAGGGYVMSSKNEEGSTVIFTGALYNSPTAQPTKNPTQMGYKVETDDQPEYASMTDDEKKALFDLFIESYQKSYADKDVQKRFKKFKKNLKTIDKRNKLERAYGGSAVHGITKFTDYDEDEFAAVFLTASPNGASSGAIMTEVASYEGTEDSITWEGIYTSGIHDQGYCGACWAYSVTEQMQADAIRAGLIDLNISLSAQQILSCDSASFGCGGGWTERAYQYVQSAGGVALEEDYPYTSYYDMTGTCQEDPDAFYMTTDGYYTVGSEQAMIDYVKSTGPLSACVDATNWATYVKGVVTVCGTEVDHCVQIIGVNTISTEGYWMIRNSWGTEWGEGGYIRLSVGNNTCAITNDPTFSKPVMLSGDDRRRLKAAAKQQQN